MAKKGLTQANTLRSNNTTSTGYGIVYADEIIGSRSVKTKEDLNKLPDWVLGKDNKLEKGTTYYVENEKCFYIYTGDGWQKSFKSIGLPVKSWYAYDNDVTGTAATSQILDISKIIKDDDLYVGTLDGIEEQPHPFATIVVYNDEVNKVPIAYITLFESSDPDNPENNTVVASAKVFGVITKNVFPKTPDFNNINYYEGNCRPLDTGSLITTWRQTGGNSITNKVLELNIKVNTIKTSEIDFTTDTLQKFNDSISSGDHVIKTQYSVVDAIHDNIVGQMLLIGDSMGHMVTEILITSAILKNGVINWNEHSDTVVNTYIRRNHVKEGGNSSIAVGSWSTWTYYSGEGQFNDFKILVAKELNKKVNTSDVVQQTGDSTTSVMSQKVVTDAIQAEINRATAAEEANAQAIANETQARIKTDEQLNTTIEAEKNRAEAAEEVLNGKIDAQKNEINVAKEEALQAIAENEQSAITNFNSQRVIPEMLSESTKLLIEASGGGTITNLADDEDITSVDDGTGSNVLKFADRAYNPDNFSGKGYKVLRKNIKLVDYKIRKDNIVYIDLIETSSNITIENVSFEEDLLEIGSETNIKFKDIILNTTLNTVYLKVSYLGSGNVTKYYNIFNNSELYLSNNALRTDTTYVYCHWQDMYKDYYNWNGEELLSNQTESINKNILTQDDFKDDNTIYVVRYDFDLNDEIIKLPYNTTIIFNGGSIKNGRIFSDNKTSKLHNFEKYTGEFRNRIFIGKFFNYANNNELTWKLEDITRNINMSIIGNGINQWFYTNDRQNTINTINAINKTIKAGINDTEIWVNLGFTQIDGYYPLSKGIERFIEIAKANNFNIVYIRTSMNQLSSEEETYNELYINTWQTAFKQSITPFLELNTVKICFSSNEVSKYILKENTPYYEGFEAIDSWLKDNNIKHAMSLNYEKKDCDSRIKKLPNLTFFVNTYPTLFYCDAKDVDINSSTNTIDYLAYIYKREVIGLCSLKEGQNFYAISEMGISPSIGGRYFVDYAQTPYDSDLIPIGIKLYMQGLKESSVLNNLKYLFWWSLTLYQDNDINIIYKTFKDLKNG